MISFQVAINGKLLCTAGVDDDGVISTIVSWGGRRGRDRANADLQVGGLTKGVHLRWVDGFDRLAVGDVVTVRVIDAESVDPPIEKKPSEIPVGQPPSADDPARCAFCGKHETEVDALVPGPVVSICDKCISVCARLAQELSA
jgi:hypothetical protein